MLLVERAGRYGTRPQRREAEEELSSSGKPRLTSKHGVSARQCPLPFTDIDSRSPSYLPAFTGTLTSFPDTNVMNHTQDDQEERSRPRHTGCVRR